MPKGRLKPLEALFVINGANYCSHLIQEITPVAGIPSSQTQGKTPADM